MKPAIRYLSLGLLAGMLLSGCWSGAFTGATLFYSRKELSHKLQSQYIAIQATNILADHQATFKNCNIAAAGFNYDLILVGQAPTPALRLQAEKLVKAIPNIRRLFNLITIEPPIPKTQQLEDSWITAKIKSQMIANNDVDPKQFKVVTEDGVVYLLGDSDKQQASIVVDIARNTNGVIKVVRIFRYLGYIK